MAGKHILVIDDCQTVRELVGDLLVESGYSCAMAEDGATGLELAQRQTPDLVLLDFIMPRMNGFQFMQAFRVVENNKEIPVVLVSVKADSMGEKFMRATGAADALTKPFTRDSLLTVVEHALSVARIGAAGATGERKPFLSGERAKRLPVRDPMRESAGALSRIREEIARRVTASLREVGVRDPETGSIDDTVAAAISDGFIVELLPDFAKVDPSAGVASFAGSTEAINVGEVVQLLVQGLATGTLEIHGPGMIALMIFDEGRVAMARLQGGPEEFLLGRYLLKEDLVSAEELRRLLSTTEERLPLGERLIKMGCISRDDLVQALEEQTTEVIFEVLRWTSSSFRFLPGSIPQEARTHKLRSPVGELLMEGLRRVDEWHVIEKHVPDFDIVLARSTAGAEALGAETRLSSEEARVLDFVNGARTVRDIIRESRLGSFEACKIMHQFLTMKMIRKVQ